LGFINIGNTTTFLESNSPSFFKNKLDFIATLNHDPTDLDSYAFPQHHTSSPASAASPGSLSFPSTSPISASSATSSGHSSASPRNPNRKRLRQLSIDTQGISGPATLDIGIMSAPPEFCHSNFHTTPCFHNHDFNTDFYNDLQTHGITKEDLVNYPHLMQSLSPCNHHSFQNGHTSTINTSESSSKISALDQMSSLAIPLASSPSFANDMVHFQDFPGFSSLSHDNISNSPSLPSSAHPASLYPHSPVTPTSPGSLSTIRNDFLTIPIAKRSYSESSSFPTNSLSQSSFSMPSVGDLSQTEFENDLSKPRLQKLRFENDNYTPKWARFAGHQKEGLCEQCPKPGKWLQLKNSAYWYWSYLMFFEIFFIFYFFEFKN